MIVFVFIVALIIGYWLGAYKTRKAVEIMESHYMGRINYLTHHLNNADAKIEHLEQQLEDHTLGEKP